MSSGAFIRNELISPRPKFCAHDTTPATTGKETKESYILPAPEMFAVCSIAATITQTQIANTKLENEIKTIQTSIHRHQTPPRSRT